MVLNGVSLGSVPIISIEDNQWIAAIFVVVERRAIDNQGIDIAVVVVIEKCSTVAIRFDDVVLGRAAVDIHRGDAHRFGDVREGRKSCLGAGAPCLPQQKHDRDETNAMKDSFHGNEAPPQICRTVAASSRCRPSEP